MNTLPVILWGALCCGLTALFTSLWWYAAHEATKRNHAKTFEALMFERNAHDDTRKALKGCHPSLVINVKASDADPEEVARVVTEAMNKARTRGLTVVDGGAS
jgi:hypothetical protein